MEIVSTTDVILRADISDLQSGGGSTVTLAGLPEASSWVIGAGRASDSGLFSDYIEPPGCTVPA